MTTGRINQITILKHGRAEQAAQPSQVVRFATSMRDTQRQHDDTTSVRWPPQDLCFRDLQPTRDELAKRR